MTKPRPRRQIIGTGIDEVTWRFLHDANTPEDDRDHGWQLIGLRFARQKDDPIIYFVPDRKTAEEHWVEHREQVLKWWVSTIPVPGHGVGGASTRQSREHVSVAEALRGSSFSAGTSRSKITDCRMRHAL